MPDQLEAVIPDEPHDCAVVLDAEGIAWQHDVGTNLWQPARMVRDPQHVMRPMGLPWAHLLVERGPVVLLVPDTSDHTQR